MTRFTAESVVSEDAKVTEDMEVAVPPEELVEWAREERFLF